LAETCNQYLKRGSKVLIEGRLNADPQSGGPRVYTRQDGSTGASFEITAETVRFLSTRAEDESFQASEPGGSQIEDDDIPF
jgi:single-strand DNA-binding protein